MWLRSLVQVNQAQLDRTVKVPATGKTGAGGMIAQSVAVHPVDALNRELHMMGAIFALQRAVDKPVSFVRTRCRTVAKRVQSRLRIVNAGLYGKKL